MSTRRLGIARMLALGLLVALCLTVRASDRGGLGRHLQHVDHADVGHHAGPVRRRFRRQERLGRGRRRHDPPHRQRRHDVDGADVGHDADPVRRRVRGRRATAGPSGAGGTIRHTTNGGTTWTAQTSGTTQTLNGVAFVDASNGWAVGAGGTIRHTANGGAHVDGADVGHDADALRASRSRTPATAGPWAAEAPSATPPTAARPGASQSSGVRTRPSTASPSSTPRAARLVGASGTIRHTTNGGTLLDGADVGHDADALRRRVRRPQRRLGGRRRRHDPVHDQRRLGLDRPRPRARRRPCAASRVPPAVCGRPATEARSSPTFPTRPRRRRPRRGCNPTTTRDGSRRASPSR